MRKYSKLALSLLLTLAMLLQVVTFAGATTDERQIYQNDNFIFEKLSDNTITIHFYTGTATKVTVPSHIGGVPVKSVESLAFYDTCAVDVTISEGITTLKKQAFFYSRDLQSVSLPSTLENVGYGLFRYCTNLKSVTFAKDCKVLGSYMFYGCTSLESVKLPVSVANINQGMFSYCESLKQIELPDNLEIISSYAFYGSGLESVKLPAKLRGIHTQAFAQSVNLNTITCSKPAGFYVAPDAFEGCMVDSPSDISCYSLRGSFNNWEQQHFNPTSDNSSLIETTVYLDAGHYEFKIYSSETGEWLGSPATILGACNNYAFRTSYYTNASLEITEPGVYTFTVDVSDRINRLRVSVSSPHTGTSSPSTNPTEITSEPDTVPPTTNTEPSSDMVTVYFCAKGEWEEVYIYGFYGILGADLESEHFGVYPGTKMSFVRTNEWDEYIYSCEVPADIDYIKFSDGSFENYRTVEIPNSMLYDNICFYLAEKTGTNKWSVGTYKYSPPDDSTDPTETTEPNIPDSYRQLETDLEMAIEKAEVHLIYGNYTDESTNVLSDAIDNANLAINNRAYEEFEGHIAAIESAIDALVPLELSGDANKNGAIDISDATLVLKYVGDLITLDEETYKLADANKDENVNVKDATLISKSIVGLTDALDTTPVYNPPEPCYPDLQEGIYVGDSLREARPGDKITYSVDLAASELFEDIQAAVYYDSSVLELVRIASDDPYTSVWEIEGRERCPNLDGVIFNADLDGVVRFNASNVNGFDFKEEQTLVSLVFIVKDTTYSEINCVIENMAIQGDGSEKYFNFGIPEITDGIIITESLEVPFTEITPSSAYDETTVCEEETTPPDNTESTTAPDPTSPESDFYIGDTNNFFDFENTKVTEAGNDALNKLADLAPLARDIWNIGDANNDGNVNIADATLIQKHLASLIKINDQQFKKCSDVDTDGKISIKDVTKIQKFLVGSDTLL